MHGRVVAVRQQAYCAADVALQDAALQGHWVVLARVAGLVCGSADVGVSGDKSTCYPLNAVAHHTSSLDLDHVDVGLELLPNLDGAGERAAQASEQPADT